MTSLTPARLLMFERSRELSRLFLIRTTIVNSFSNEQLFNYQRAINNEQYSLFTVRCSLFTVYCLLVKLPFKQIKLFHINRVAVAIDS